MSLPLLRIEEITKSFGGNRAVGGVSFDIAQGEAVALIGPNGAGKTHPDQRGERPAPTG